MWGGVSCIPVNSLIVSMPLSACLICYLSTCFHVYLSTQSHLICPSVYLPNLVNWRSTSSLAVYLPIGLFIWDTVVLCATLTEREQVCSVYKKEISWKPFPARQIHSSIHFLSMPSWDLLGFLNITSDILAVSTAPPPVVRSENPSFKIKIQNLGPKFSSVHLIV